MDEIIMRFSDFIKNATADEKTAVYTEVMRRATDLQNFTLHSRDVYKAYEAVNNLNNKSGANPPSNADRAL